MGGQEGVRGYLLQAIIATLDSLNSEDWTTVSIEPNSKSDKVDILWTEKDGSEIVYQVKSSINNFEKAGILSWISELIKDSPSAKKFKLVLIGNCSSNTKSFFNSCNKNLSEKTLDAKFHHLIAYRDNIEVDIKIFDLNTLNDAINFKVHEFLSRKNLKLDFSTVALIADGLKIQFLRFSTQGRKMAREEFASNLLKWIEFNYQSYMGGDKNELELQFYLSGVLPFSNILVKNFNLSPVIDSDYIQKKVNSLKSIVDEINQIKLTKPLNKFKNTPHNNSLRMLGFQRPILGIANRTPSKISEGEINLIQNLAENILQLELDIDFFNTGNLEEIQDISISPFFESFQSNYIGTSDEKKKRNLLDDFCRGLRDLNDQIIYWKHIGQFRLIPIVLKNNGGIPNESIDIQLHFSLDAQIVLPKDFPTPERYNTLKEFNSAEGILNLVLKHNKDSKVKEFDYRYFQDEIEFDSLPFRKSFEEKKKSEIRKYREMLDAIFEYEIFYDNENKITLSCTINSLKPNDTVALPSYLFLVNNTDFQFDYEINSRNLSSKIVGSLTVNDASTSAGF